LLKHFPDLHHKDAEIIAKLLEYKKKEEEKTEEAEPEEDIEISINPLSEITEAEAKPREWLIKGLCQRGTYSQIQGSGGAGKSIFAMTVAIMATNKKSYLCDLFSFEEDCKVLIINNEDPQEELDRRALAILKCLNANWVDAEKIEYNLDNVYIKSYLDKPIKLLDKTHNKLHLRPKSIAALQKFIIEKEIDIVIFDPLISFHNAEENLNKDMDMFVREGIIKPFASETNAAVIGVHHVAKGTSNNDTDIEGNTNASRGASAITNAARSVFRLAGMNMETAKSTWTNWKQDKELLEQRHDYVQIAFGKVNNTKATEGNWLYKMPVNFRNKNGELIDGIALKRDYSIESAIQDAEKQKKKEANKDRKEIIETMEKANLVDVGEDEGVWLLMDIAECLEKYNDPYIQKISHTESSGKSPRQMKNKGSQRDGEDYRKTTKSIANHIQRLFEAPYTYQDKVFQYENKKLGSGNKKRWLRMTPKVSEVPADIDTDLMKSMEEDAQLS
jgi:RecA-family ATPase